MSYWLPEELLECLSLCSCLKFFAAGQLLISWSENMTSGKYSSWVPVWLPGMQGKGRWCIISRWLLALSCRDPDTNWGALGSDRCECILHRELWLPRLCSAPLLNAAAESRAETQLPHCKVQNIFTRLMSPALWKDTPVVRYNWYGTDTQPLPWPSYREGQRGH